MTSPLKPAFVRGIEGLVITGAFVAVGSCVRYETTEIQRALAHVLVWSLYLSALAVCTGAAYSMHQVNAAWRSLKRPEKGALGGLVLLGIALGSIAPKEHRMFFDEHIYESIAQSIAHKGVAAVANFARVDGGAYELFDWILNKQPNGYPFILSFFFRLAGVHEWVAFATNAGLYLVTSLSLFGFCLTWFSSPRTGLIAALTFLLIPQNMIWASATSTEMSAVAATTLALTMVSRYFVAPSVPGLLASAGMIGLAAQMRPESLFILTCAIAALIWTSRSTRGATPRDLRALAALVILLLMPHLTHLYLLRNHAWEGHQGRFTLHALSRNYLTNLLFYVQNVRFPLGFTLLAGLGGALGTASRSRWPVGVWLLAAIGIFLPFYAGGYGVGAGERYSVIGMPAFSIFVALGIEYLSVRVSARLLCVGVLATALNWAVFIPAVRTLGTHAGRSRADTYFCADMSAKIPAHSVVITQIPTVFLVHGNSAIQMSTVQRNPLMMSYLHHRFPGGVFLHYGFWCNGVDKAQAEFCERFTKRWGSELIAERTVLGQRMALYRVSQ